MSRRARPFHMLAEKTGAERVADLTATLICAGTVSLGIIVFGKGTIRGLVIDAGRPTTSQPGQASNRYPGRRRFIHRAADRS